MHANESDKFIQTIKIKIIYDEKLQIITGVESEEAVVSDNLTFTGFLHFIFSSYPKFHKKYPPGTIGFLVNGKPPREETLLYDNDKIYFAAV